jgi:hypothetical protein
MATVAQLLAQLRLDLEDPELPGTGVTPDSDSLWSNAELLHYLDEAQRIFASQTDCLPDATNFKSSIKAGQTWVERDPLIVRIRSGYMTTAKRTITPTNLVDIERGHATDDYGLEVRSRWRDSTGTPRFVIEDMDAFNSRLAPIPTEADSIEWSVYRLPLEAIDSTGSALEIDDRFHYDLLVWAKKMAFSKQDVETQDMTRQRDMERDWNTRVIPEAQAYFRKKYRRSGVTSYGGIY